MSYTPTIYRLVIVDPASSNPFTPGDATVNDDHLWVTSSRDSTLHNYITSPPSDDGDRLELLTSAIADAACQIGISDAGAYVTGFLANASARYQLLGREAYCEKSTDAGTSWTIVRHGFVSDIELPRAQEFLVTIGGARRKERRTPVSAILSGLTLPHTVFRPTAIIGGPILGGLPGYQQNYGLPLFTVTAIEGGLAPDDEQWVRLRYLSGPMPLDFGDPNKTTQGFKFTRHGFGAQPIAPPFYEVINAMASSFYDTAGYASVIAGQQTVLRGRYHGIGVFLYDPASPGSMIQSTPLTARVQLVQSQPSGSTAYSKPWFMSPNNDIYLVGFDTLPSVSDVFLLAAVPLLLTPDFPLYYGDHPLVVVANALGAIGSALNGTSAVAAKDALGLSLYHPGCLTDPSETVSDWINRMGAFFGFALIPNADSTEFAVIPTRDRYDGVTSLPTFDDDALRAIGGPTYKLAESSRRTTVRTTIAQFIPWDSAMDVARPYSDLVPFEVPFEVVYENAGEPGQTIELSVPGTIATRCHLTSSSQPTPLRAGSFIEALSLRLFDRHGRGTPEYQFPITGTTALVAELGEMADMDTSHLPNAQSGGATRGGPRPGRLTARTREPAGDVLTFIDEGTGVPYAGAFDIDSVTEGPTPDSVLIALSGGNQLDADGATVDIYFSAMPAGNNSAPTDRGVLIASTGGDPVNDVFTNDFGPLPAGDNWWFRAEAWIEGGSPSTSTAWWNINGADPTAPPTPPTPTGDISALTVSDIGTDYAVLTWTNTNLTESIRVSYKLGTASTYTAVIVMPPGSVTYTIFGLVPATAYDFQVEMISSVGQVWTTLTASDTTVAGTPTLVLFTPLNPRAWAGSMGGISTLGSVGLLVEPVFNTVHEVEFEMTPETAVGSGIPDGWPSDVTPAVDSASQYWPVTSATLGVNGSVDVFSWHNVPNDGRLRYFRARARKLQSDGSFIYSGWTAVVSVMPWIVFVPLPPPGAGSVVDGGTAYVTGPNQVDGGSDVANNTYSGPPLEGGSA